MREQRRMIHTLRTDSPLGRWTSSRWTPSPDDALFGAIDHVWDFDGVLACRREQIFPSGTLQLVVQLDEPHRPLELPREPFPAVCLDGLQTVTTTIEAPRGRCRVLGITLTPLGAFSLLATPLHHFTNRSLDLCDVVGPSAAQLAERLDEQRGSAGRVEAAVDWLRGRLSCARAADPVVAAVFERIASDGGHAAMREIEELGGRSHSRFAARFREQVGLAPKRYARVLRFHRALERLGAARAGDSLAAIALALGYYDQAHMNADFREHAGLTPRRYVEALRFPNSSHVARDRGGDDEAGSFFQEQAARIA